MAIGEYTNIGGNAGNYIPITIVNEPNKTPSDEGFTYNPIEELSNLDTTFLSAIQDTLGALEDKNKDLKNPIKIVAGIGNRGQVMNCHF